MKQLNIFNIHASIHKNLSHSIGLTLLLTSSVRLHQKMSWFRWQTWSNQAGSRLRIICHFIPFFTEEALLNTQIWSGSAILLGNFGRLLVGFLFWTTGMQPPVSCCFILLSNLYLDSWDDSHPDHQVILSVCQQSSFNTFFYGDFKIPLPLQNYILCTFWPLTIQI